MSILLLTIPAMIFAIAVAIVPIFWAMRKDLELGLDMNYLASETTTVLAEQEAAA